MARATACLPCSGNLSARHFPLADGYQNARDRAIVLLLYEMALAPEEVRALLWKDLRSSAELAWESLSKEIADTSPALPASCGLRAAVPRSNDCLSCLNPSPEHCWTGADSALHSAARRWWMAITSCFIHAGAVNCRYACCFMSPHKSFSARTKRRPRAARSLPAARGPTGAAQYRHCSVAARRAA